MFKLVVTDIDGTLMNDSSEVPEEIFDLIQLLQLQNVKFAVASGRQIKDLKKIFKGLNDVCYIAQNGSYVEFGGAELRNLAIPANSIEEIIQIAYRYNLFPMFYTNDAILIQDDDTRFISKLNTYKVTYTYTSKINLSIEIGKVSLMSLDDNASNFKDKFSSLSDLDTYVSCKDLIDINLTNCNKGTALALVQETMGILPKETISFGDAENDISLFKNSGLSYAMMNAPLSVKQYADQIAPSNNHKGVITVLSDILKALQS